MAEPASTVRARRARGFMLHVVVFLIGNAALFLINWIGDDDGWWFYWPMLIWAIVLAIHAVVAFGWRAVGSEL